MISFLQEEKALTKIVKKQPFMDKKEREIFEEVINSLKALKTRVEALENEVAGLKGFAEPAGDDGEVIDIEFDDIDIEPVEETVEVHEIAEEAAEPAAAAEAVAEPVAAAEPVADAEPVEEGLVEEDLPVGEEKAPEDVVDIIGEDEEAVVEEKPLDEPIIAEGTEEELEVEALTEEVAEEVEEVTEAVAGEVAAEEVAVVPEAEEPAAEENVTEIEQVEDLPALETESAEDLPEEPVEEELFGGMSLFGEVVEPKVHHHKTRKTLNDSAHSSKAVIDVMADKLAWKHDMPGSVVKDIKSAISLNDRVLFISSLFREDSMLYQDTMSRLNAMASLDEAVSYLTETFPEWKLDSDSVYRFMMAVRRKLR